MARRIKTLTKAQEAKYAKLKASLSDAFDKVYAAAPDDHTPFSQCYELASRCVRAAYDGAQRAISDFERNMVVEGRGYFDGRYHFYAY